MLPFFNPAAAKRLMEKLAQGARQLRWGGLISIAGGSPSVDGAQWVRMSS
jgi:uncharacterized protein YjeT (DUF2065 family)